ncbi:hypothetical protein QQ045_007029 [Rhodiola kirilowii]
MLVALGYCDNSRMIFTDYGSCRSDPRKWFHVNGKGDIICIYQGHMDNVDLFKNKFLLDPEDDDVKVVIQVFKLLRELGHQTPPICFQSMVGDFSFIVYDVSSNLPFVTSICYVWRLPTVLGH